MNEVVDWLLFGGKWIGLLLLGTMITLCFRAGLLNPVKKLRRSWVRLHTTVVPSAERTDRREWAEHMMWEEYEEDRRQGYGPDLIAVRMAWTWLRGIPADIAWSLASLPIYSAPSFREEMIILATYFPLSIALGSFLARVVDPAIQVPFVKDMFIVTLSVTWLSQILAHWFWRNRTWIGLRTYLSPAAWSVAIVLAIRTLVKTKARRPLS